MRGGERGGYKPRIGPPFPLPSLGEPWLNGGSDSARGWMEDEAESEIGMLLATPTSAGMNEVRVRNFILILQTQLRKIRGQESFLIGRDIASYKHFTKGFR